MCFRFKIIALYYRAAIYFHNFFAQYYQLVLLVPSVLWRCWLGGRKGIQPVKKLEWWGAGVVICLERGADLHMVSWCHCHSLSLASVKSRLVLPFWYRLTWVVPEKGPLNGSVCVHTRIWMDLCTAQSLCFYVWLGTITFTMYVCMHVCMYVWQCTVLVRIVFDRQARPSSLSHRTFTYVYRTMHERRRVARVL